MSAYKLMTVLTGRVFEDKGWTLSDSEAPAPSLVRTIYDKRQIEFGPKEAGIYRFADWLPVQRTLKGSSATVTYRSGRLADALGLENLYVAFSGWWPEKGALMETCTFKETEAYSVCGRLGADFDKILVVSSAGNTARAFARVCSMNNIPLVLTVPYDCRGALWFKEPVNPCVKLICTPAGSDYFDAIALGDKIASSPRFLAEGGAKNVARRDGMSTTVLSAAEVIGRIPDCYFQAIGSGTGTIAAWEANLRLIGDGRFGSHKMRLYPSQNIPFTPMHDAWKAGSRALLPMDDDEARAKALQITAKVLSNRKPPYSIAGGLFDALSDAGGDIELADNSDIERCRVLFAECEGVDISAEAAVALQGLINAVSAGKVSRKENVMLNVTGGGSELCRSKGEIFTLEPAAIMTAEENDVISRVESMFE